MVVSHKSRPDLKECSLKGSAPYMGSTVQQTLVLGENEGLQRGCVPETADPDTCLKCGDMGKKELSSPLTLGHLMVGRRALSIVITAVKLYLPLTSCST